MTRKFTFTILAMLFAILGPGAKAWGQTYEKVMELDMTTKAAGCSAYNTTTTYGDWKITNGANYNKTWAYFKMGGKSATISTYNPCYIYSTIAATKQIDKITVSLPSGSLSQSGMKVNSWGVYVYSDEAMTTQIDYVAGGTITKNAATFDFTPSAGKTWAAGYYYKVSWDLANTSSTNGIVCVDKITLYKASTPSHTLTFSATNGSITASGEDEAEIKSGDNVEEGATLDITATADDWYKFSGWSVTGTGSTLGSTTTNPTTFTMGTADATLTASFEACSVTVSSNDETMGSATYNATTHIISTSIAQNHRISSAEPYTIVPANAATLTPGDDGTFVVSGVKDQDVEITINFEALPSVAYTVFFDGNDHGTPASESITEASAGVGVTLPDCTPNTGYQFVGWATTNTATEPDAGVVGATYYPSADTTLYAVYNSVYTINYMVNGVNTDAQENVLEGTPLVFPEVSAPDADHVFRGWVTEAIEGTTDTEPAYVNTTDLTATQNITYYAVFAEKSGSEPAEQKTQTLQYDTWTYYGSTTDKDTYRLFHSGSYIESAEFDLSKLSKVIVYGGSFGGGSNNSLTIGDGTNTWKSVTVSGSSQTGTNTYTDGTPLSGTGKLRITSNSGTATGSGVRISKVEIFTMEGGYTYSNFCTTVVTKTLTSISLSGEYPTEFWKDEAFSHEGMTVTAHYNDESTKDVTSSATFTGYDMATAGEQTVTVTYEGKTTTYGITVKNIANTQETAYTVTEAKSLIDANPAELATTEVYVKGTVSKIVTEWSSQYGNITFDVSEDGQTTGDQFRFYRNFKGANNTPWASAAECPAVGDDVIGLGKLTKYGSTYEFDAGNYLVSHIRVATLSIEDITVEIDGDINPVITTNVPSYTIAYSSDNEEVVLANGDEMVTMGLGSATITATLTAEGYKNATTTFTVEVIKALESIAVKTAPTTTSYKAGDFFDPTGLVITATYSDASTGDIAYAGNEDSFTFDPSLETALTTDITSVTIKYAGKTTTQEITVRALYKYDITWMANGAQFTTTKVTEGNALVLPGTNPDNVGDMVFQGWINTDNYYDAETAPEYIVPDEIIPTEAMTFYAVYAKEHKDIQETTSTMDFSEETYSDWEIDDKIVRTANQGTGGTGDFAGKISTNNTYITFNKKVKVESFGFSFKRTSTNSNYNVYIETSTDNETWTAHQTYPMSDFDNGSYTTKTDDTFDGKTDLYVRFHCYNTTATRYVDDVIIRYMGEDIAYSNFCTTVKPIEEDKTISGNTVWNGNITINEHTVTIGSGAVLTVNGALINTDPENLIIEDGAQLIVNNKGVQATMEKNIDNTSKESNVSWYTISSPLAASVNVTDVTNLIPTTVTATDYDLYYLDEAIGMWINSRIHGDDDDYPVIANPDFTTIDKGRGYIYSNTTAADIAFAGEVNVADVECNLTIGAANGFNLIGNPFTQNIELANVAGVTLAEGFYVLNNDNTWRAKRTDSEDSEIKPLQGFLVQATEEGGTARISKNASVRGERSKEQSTNIEMIVSNSNHRDNAYAMFGEGIGLNKINHRNAEAPMLYIPQGGEDFAIAFMNENTTLFPLNFKAMTTGSYSISLKATDDISTLVLVDNMTGAETDMLLEESYQFIGSPRDGENRFTVKLGISHNDGQADSEHFVYQNGSELVINGEGTLQIFDVLGRVVVSEEVHGQTVNVGGLTTGAYVVRMTGNEIKTQKIIIR